MRKGLNLGKTKIMARLSNNPLEEYYQPVSHEILYNMESNHISEAEAYSRLGRMYFDGLGVAEDDIKGCRYYEIAYDKGSRNIRIGDYLMMGVYRHIETREAIESGITRDLRKAIKWYTHFMEGCIQTEDEQGINIALSHIGRVCVDDEIRDYKSAYMCLTKASSQEAEALFYLARMYDRGLYVRRNREKAECYISKILETPDFKGDVFYDSAQEIIECWEKGVPEEIIDEIISNLG